MRTAAWTILIALGCTAVIYTLIYHGGPPGFAVAIMAVLSWIAFGALLGHFTGLKRPVANHFGKWKPQTAQSITHVVSANDRPSLQLALNRLHERHDPRKPILGIPQQHTKITALVAANPRPVPLEWERLPRSADDMIDCITNGIYLLEHKARPYAAMLRLKSSSSRGRVMLEVMAESRDTAQAALDEILNLAQELSVYRGAVVTLEKSPTAADRFAIKFHELPEVKRDQIILPEDVMQVVERNVTGLLSHAQVLKRAGRGTRHGVLLHGPPGTGKTLVTKYLARACPGYTVILLTGRNFRFVRESCQLARLLAPSIVVIEGSRSNNTTILHWLMDEMDGLGAKSDTIFLLTTNRPEVLEPALAARPGRVDQAIYFPLPDRDCRRRLFERFTKGLDLAAANLDNLLDRTEGASPAFIEELFRKAALMAAERGERSEPLRLTTDDFTRALRELLEFGGDLTRNLLGFTPTNGRPSDKPSA
jgi:SpoVK/Ycf46/Vps4 family AAA+-type ATPase